MRTNTRDYVEQNMREFSTRRGLNSFPECPVKLQERLENKYGSVDDSIFAHAFSRVRLSWFSGYCSLFTYESKPIEALMSRSDFYFIVRGIHPKIKRMISTYGSSWKMQPARNPEKEIWETLSCLDAEIEPKVDILGFLANARYAAYGEDRRQYLTEVTPVVQEDGPLTGSILRKQIMGALAGKVLPYDNFLQILKQEQRASDLEKQLDYEIPFMGGSLGSEQK